MYSFKVRVCCEENKKGEEEEKEKEKFKNKYRNIRRFRIN